MHKYLVEIRGTLINYAVTFIKSVFGIQLYLISALAIYGNLPELSSINPIEFDEVAQKIVASGEATFDFGSVKLRADQITYYKRYDLLNAQGNVNFTTNNHRLLSDDFSLSVEENTFSLSQIKYGFWPYFVDADSGGGSLSEIHLNESTFYYGEPRSFSPNFKAESILITNTKNEKNVSFKNTFVRLGKIPIFFLPQLKVKLNNNPFLGISNIGYANEFGTYFQSTSLIPFSDWLRAGLNLDYYSKRGTLVGPTVQYYRENPTQFIQGSLSAGFIDDSMETGTDILNRTIDPKRSFVLAQHKQIHNNRFFVTAQVQDTSDSEVIRDFREPLYIRNQFPLNFVESTYLNQVIALNAFAHFKSDDFSTTRERLPEINLFLLPNYLLGTQFFHRGSLRFSKIDEDLLSPDSVLFNKIDALNYTLLDLNYALSRRFSFKNWLSITPKIEYRSFHFSLEESPSDPLLNVFESDHQILNYGLDISSDFYAVYPTLNHLWNVKGLRHHFRPTLSLSKIHALSSDDFNQLAPTQLPSVLDLSRPALSLLDIRNSDQIHQRTLTRFRLENYFQTRNESYGSRNLMELHLTADFYHQYQNRNTENRTHSNKNALWLEYKLFPAPWIKFDLASRLDSESFRLLEQQLRLVLKSSEFWEIGIASYFKKDFSEQISLDYSLKLTEKMSFSSILWSDLKENEISRFSVGIDSISPSNWRTTYSINYEADQRRLEDVSFDIGIELLPY